MSHGSRYNSHGPKQPVFILHSSLYQVFTFKSCLASFQWDCCDFSNPAALTSDVADPYSIAWQQLPLRIVLGFVIEKTWSNYDFSSGSNK